MVNTELETLSTCKLALKITMPAADVDKIRHEQEKLAQKDVVIQGFRKGKAPLERVKSMYAGMIERNTIDEDYESDVVTSEGDVIDEEWKSFCFLSVYDIELKFMC